MPEFESQRLVAFNAIALLFIAIIFSIPEREGVRERDGKRKREREKKVRETEKEMVRDRQP